MIFTIILDPKFGLNSSIYQAMATNLLDKKAHITMVQIGLDWHYSPTHSTLKEDQKERSMLTESANITILCMYD